MIFKRHKHQKYRFQGRTGYLIHPTLGNVHTRLALSHTAGLDPWQDTGLHFHCAAEEAFFLVSGRLDFVVADSLITLHPNEFLLIQPGVPHAIVGGEGKIEHFGIQAPAGDEKQAAGPLPQGLSLSHEDDRRVIEEWGQRIPLYWPKHHVSASRDFFQHMSLGHFNLPMADIYLQTYHRLPLERESWMYYLVIEGSQTLGIKRESITIEAGELLEVPPRVRPKTHSLEIPCWGITIGVPAK